MKLVVGLGNPEPRYARTRHNVGWRIAEHLADRMDAGPWKEKFSALVTEVTWGARRIAVARPTTYMNASGLAVRSLVDFWKLAHEDLVVLVDDLWLDLGRLRIRGGGTDGGHNGLASVIEHLGHDEFARLRVGVGPAPDQEEHAAFVLSEFREAEVETIEQAIHRAADAVRCWVGEGLEAAMNRFNRAADSDD